MKTILIGVIVVLTTVPGLGFAGPIPGEVSCDKGLEMARVQALVKRTAEALKKDQAKVVQQINAGDQQWKDGALYVVVFQGTTVLAHGYWPWLAGQDLASTPHMNTYPWIGSGRRMAMERNGGCIQFRFHNPAKSGQVEEKIGFSMKISDTVWLSRGTYLIK